MCSDQQLQLTILSWHLSTPCVSPTELFNTFVSPSTVIYDHAALSFTSQDGISSWSSNCFTDQLHCPCHMSYDSWPLTIVWHVAEIDFLTLQTSAMCNVSCKVLCLQTMCNDPVNLFLCALISYKSPELTWIIISQLHLYGCHSNWYLLVHINLLQKSKKFWVIVPPFHLQWYVTAILELW